MNDILVEISKEFNDFEKHHKNLYNIEFHVFCGIVYMTFLILSLKEYKYELFVIYSALIYRTFETPFLTYPVLLIMIEYFSRVNDYTKSLNSLYCFIIFFVFYFGPELSHILTNEKTVLNMNNITPFTAFVNVFYLLPFSMKCLFGS